MVKVASLGSEPAVSTRTRWLRAAFGGPMAFVLVTASLAMCFGEEPFTKRLSMSLRGLLLAPVVALFCGGLLVVVDLCLALVRVRVRPVGIGAWLSSAGFLVAAAIVWGILGALLRGTLEDETLGAITIVTGLAVALLTRLALGKRPAPR